jgi:hypothetical protein
MVQVVDCLLRAGIANRWPTVIKLAVGRGATNIHDALDGRERARRAVCARIEDIRILREALRNRRLLEILRPTLRIVMREVRPD